MSRRRKRSAVSAAGARTPATVGPLERLVYQWWQPAVVLLALAVLSARLVLLISRHAVNIFFMDQWDFNDATLFQKHSLWEMFRWQHGPHRQGMGAVISFLVEPWFRWNSRSESFLVGAIFVLAAVCALWLKKRLFGSITAADVSIPLIFLTPLQFETLFMTANLAHGPMPILLILFYCLAWTIPLAPLRYGLVLLINFAAIHTGFGLFLGFITPLVLGADYLLALRHQPAGTVYFSISLLLSLASLGCFFVGYINQSAVACSPNLFQSPGSFAQFLLLIFANVFGVKGMDWWPAVLGGLLAAAMLAALALNLRNLVLQGSAVKPGHWSAAILLAYTLLFAIATAYGRSCLGPQAAPESRYVPYFEAGLLGLYFFLLALRRSALRTVLLLAFLASLCATLPIPPQDAFTMQFFSFAKARWRQCYLASEDIAGCTPQGRLGVYPRPERNDLKAKLEFLKRTRQNLYADAP